jgi:hypothetical protein
LDVFCVYRLLELDPEVDIAELLARPYCEIHVTAPDPAVTAATEEGGITTTVESSTVAPTPEEISRDKEDVREVGVEEVSGAVSSNESEL